MSLPAVFDGNTKVWFVSAINNKSAPTQAEVRAGTDITTYVTKDGVQPGTTNNRVDNDSIDDTFIGQLMGTQQNSFALKMRRFYPTDSAYALLGAYGVTGFLVVAENQYTGGVPTTGDKVDVYPIQTGNPNIPNSAKDTMRTWTADIAVTSKPALNVAIA